MPDFSAGWIWMAAAGFFFLCGILLWFSPIVVTTEMKKINLDDDFDVKVRALFGLVHLHWKMPILEWTNRGIKMKSESSTSKGHTEEKEQLNAAEVMNKTNRIKRLVQQVEGAAGLAKSALSKVKVSQWEWSTEVGTGDAMWTAMSTGMLWSVKTTAIGVASQIIHLTQPPVIAVQPAYNRTCFVSHWKLVGSIRLGQAGIAGIRLVIGLRKLRAGTVGVQRLFSKV
ncbi:DUF2953 domain-containing protein [Paenibacillus sp. MMS18-CY102]|uniref:DUF2953 domain-containing protein n=1 Tax=Paenibacillus sp. MMS18-CY102 TaxID=2682849 RepID=UPI0013657CCF|nr:DUF2953 domain-containing protein [Paenibacillus sp. MMS18-CY102]MWC28416.1 DUF2953 domain-containing protein [Paenibacillus sp. MMS18-CY102]